MEKVLFKEEQRFTRWWLWVILVSTLSAIAIPIVNKLMAESWNTSSEEFSRLIIYGTIAVLFIVAVLIVLVLSKLQTKITNDGILISYPPLKRKWYRITVQEIERFEIRSYKAKREYGGYGFRNRRTSGQAYIISGNIGLQLYLKNGKKLLIGTQRKQAIEYAMEKIIGKQELGVTSKSKKQKATKPLFGRKAKKILIIIAIEIVLAILIIGIIQIFK